MKIMVTGATGFIGDNLVRKLCGQGNTIHVLCRSTSDKSRLTHRDIRIFEGDILDGESIRETMRGCEIVYHLAAYARNWARDPGTFYEYNTNSLKTIFESALNFNIRRVLFTSSSVVFGSSDGSPADEKSPRRHPPFTYYEASKLAAEKILNEYLEKGLDIVSVYPTRLFGPGLLTESNSVTLMIDLYLKGKWRMIPGNGEASGNYVLVDDVANGMIKAVGSGRCSGKYILGGDNITYNQFFSAIASRSGKKHIMFHIPRNIALAFGWIEETRAKISSHFPLISPGWVRTFCVDWSFSSSKAVGEIDYNITPFNEALDITLSWLNSVQRSK